MAKQRLAWKSVGWYDLSGALASETYPSLLTLTNTFDSAGRVTKVAGSNGVNYASSGREF